MLKATFGTLIVAGVTAAGGQDDRRVMRDWPYYGGDQAGTKYSSLTDVNAATVSRVAVAWTWAPREKALAEFGMRPGNFQTTPLMIDNVLYLSTPYNRVVALNADTGAKKWSFDPSAYEDGQPPNRYRLICLDAATGARKWHDQLVHHGLWDYDNPSPPSLVTIHVDGRAVDAVVQRTKQGFAFVFDRVTGAPVWPIEERRVPPSDVAGEHAWPTQPFPTRSPAFTEQGVTLDDAFDATPALKAAAQKELQKYRIGPVFTPPSAQGDGAAAGTHRRRQLGRRGVRRAERRPVLQDGQRRQHRAGRRAGSPPASLGVAGAPGVLATAGGLVFAGGGDRARHAVDAATGAERWHADLPRRANGTPMTYRSGGGRQFIVIATGGGEDAALVAFAIPQSSNR